MRFVSVVLLVFFMFSTGTVHAAPVGLPQDVTPGFGATSWTGIDQLTTDTGAPYTGTCTTGSGFGIADALSFDGSSDAFDDAYMVFVDGAVFSPGATVDLTGTTVTAGPVIMSGLNVTVQYYFDTLASLARIVVFLNNPTGAAINATVDIPVNFGSDGGTIVQMTSSGDATVTTADRWIVTSDSNVTPGDPVNTTVLYGTGAAVTPSAVTQTVFSCAATNGVGATYNVSVPAGQTSALMLFAGLGDITGAGNTNAGAIAAAALFDDPNTLPAGALAGLTPQQQSQIVNWSLQAAAITTTVPTMGEWGMIFFMVLAGLSSVYFLRRQRSA